MSIPDCLSTTVITKKIKKEPDKAHLVNLSNIFLHKIYRSRGVPVYLAESLFVVHNT